jgi:hypothetical protein
VRVHNTTFRRCARAVVGAMRAGGGGSRVTGGCHQKS